MSAVEIRCPMDHCTVKFRQDREHDLEKIRKDIQHHLFMRHNVGVIQSHEIARHVISQQEKEKQNG